MNRLLKNKFFRENLILVIVFALIFPPYAFSDAWVADTGNEQVSRLYKDGHAPTAISVAGIDDVENTEIRVNTNPTALFYPGLKLSFGQDRKNVYEIESIRYDDTVPTAPWIVGFYAPFNNEEVEVDSPIYMELVRAAGFAEPVAVSANTVNTRVWIADKSGEDSGVTQITGWGRDEPSDTGIVTPFYIDDLGGNEFQAGDTMFKLYSQDKHIYPGIKMDFRSDNRQPDYVLETKEIDKTAYPYILTTYSGLLDHSIIGQDTAVIHIDRFRDKAPNFPQDVSANSITDRSDTEYDTAWVVNTGGPVVLSSSIAFDAESSVGYSGPDVPSYSWPHTCSGSDRILFVGVSLSTTSPAVSAVTYGGNSLTFLRADNYSTTTHNEVWYLVNPPTESNTVVVTFSAPRSTFSCGAISYTGVSQTNPIDANSGANGNSTSPYANVTVGTNDSWVMAILSTPYTTGLPSCSDTIRYNENAAQITTGADKSGPQTVGSKTISFTLPNSTRWAESIVSFKPASRDDSVVKYTQDWEYRRPITLSPSTPEDDYQIKVELNTTNFDYGNVYGTNGEDIRFTDSEGNILRYWIEKWDVSGTSTIWVKVENSGTDKIYMYYGNSNAISQSDGVNTFIFFDDFNGTDGSDIDSTKWSWTKPGNQATYSSTYAHSGTTCMKLVSALDSGGQPYHLFPAPMTGELTAWLHDRGVGTIREAMIGENYFHNVGIYGLTSTYYRYRISTGSGYVNTTVPRAVGWHKIQMRCNGTNTYFYIDGGGTPVATVPGMSSFGSAFVGNSHFNSTTDYSRW